VASRAPAAKGIGEEVRLEVGPIERATAAAWIHWADETLGQLRRQSATGACVSAEAVDDLRYYLEQWKPVARSTHDSFRWHGEIDPDQLEYLVHTFFNLDVQLSHEDRRQGEWSPPPGSARAFYLVLVRALLHALELESPARAAFVDQLRSCWPVAVEAV
jgi:hypothetical protein